MTPAQAESFAIVGEDVPLAQLRQVLSEHYEKLRSQSDRPVTRLTSFNLVVISQAEVEPELQSLVTGLTESHPSRLLWCRLGRYQNWAESTAKVSLGCRCAGREVCCEEILLDMGGEVERVPSTLLSLTHSELPTYLIWWKAGPLESSLFARLADRARLVLWEPEPGYTEPLKALQKLWLDPFSQENIIYPLVWHRMGPVRRELAAAYDRGGFKVEVSASGQLYPTLLKAWLTSRLKLKQLNPLTWKGSDVELRWREGPDSTLHQDGETYPLLLEQPVQAARKALDEVRRDPVFGELLL